jgi:predicted PilT family ATPase
MSFESKMNAISRIVIVLSTLGFIFTMKPHFLIMGIITLAIILSIYKYRKQTIVTNIKENFAQRKNKNQNKNRGSELITNPVTLDSVLRNNFHPTTKQNPFGNVLLTDIMDEPLRKAAAPSFNPDVYEDITRAVKKQTQMLNPGIKNTNKQLYGDLYDNYQMDTDMMQRFYSTANTKISNDQGAYGEWLYGSMPSAKEDNAAGNMQRYADANRYILI